MHSFKNDNINLPLNSVWLMNSITGKWKEKDNDIIRKYPDGCIEVIFKPVIFILFEDIKNDTKN